MTRKRSGFLVAALALGSLSMASGPCERRVVEPARVPSAEFATEEVVSAAEAELARRAPTGTTCGGRADCPVDQVCVESRCRHRATSVAGEILSSSARALAEAGDWEGAIATYQEAVAAYQAVRAPVPAELLCESAALLLGTATTPEAREAGAARADACFRASLPGFGPREEVRRAVARLRFQGLDVSLFDRESPPERFFTQAQSAPTVDAVTIEVAIAGDEQPGLAAIRAQLEGDMARRAIAECFIQDWEVRHERSARGSLLARYSTRLRDMGTYDTYEPELLIDKTTVAEDGFEPCVARALAAILSAPRAGRVVSWRVPFEVSARIQ